MNLRNLCLWTITLLGTGCNLKAPLDVSEACPEAQYYIKSTGAIEGYFSDMSSKFHDVFAATLHCPAEYPVCVSGIDASYCREVCRESEVFCDGRCIEPQVDMMFCGARGMCSSANPESDDFEGQACRSDQICRFGTCRCAHVDEITCNGECIDPSMDRTYCGARGLCLDADVTSENYHGSSCEDDELCRDSICVCQNRLDIRCDGQCVDPNEDSTYCGARGACSDADVNSPNYRGQSCSNGKRCENGLCACVKNWEITCDGECIDPNENTRHCGARGLCVDVDEGSENYLGTQCHEGQICVDGSCKCAKTLELSCDGNCIDPRIDRNHCGAMGLCNEDAFDNLNFVGGVCDRCEDSVCYCGDDKHLYNNSCEVDDENHCGEHEMTCNMADFPHAAKLGCRDKSCVITECEAGAFWDAEGKTCITCSELIENVAIADSISFGRYRQLAETEDQQPMVWQVLTIDDQKGVLLISKWVLEARKYNETARSITWKNSTMRSWLNGFGNDANLNGIDYTNDNFIFSAFNDEELKCIQTVINENPDTSSGIDGGGDTEDRVFLLSESDRTLFKYPVTDFTTATEYANLVTHVYITSDAPMENVQYGSYNAAHYASMWWFRTPGSTASKVRYRRCYRDGVYDASVDSTKIGVRPAVWIK